MARCDRLWGIVSRIARVENGAVFLDVQAQNEDGIRRSVALTAIVGSVAVGDRVLLNTTATALKLGTGGFDWVMAVDSDQAEIEPVGDEHIVKLRYTPGQHAVAPAEFDARMAEFPELSGLAVVVCGLHSQIAGVVAGVKSVFPGARVVLVQTDTAALPLAFSDLVRKMRSIGWLDGTITCGQAFGGDLECVSLASALQAGSVLLSADVVVVSPGPGNAGTGTALGFSGIEQGTWLDTALALGAGGVGVLRCSDADPRDRHRGLSHHSVTALGRLSARSGVVAVPEEFPTLQETVRTSAIAVRHEMVVVPTTAGMERLLVSGLRPTTMGRSVEQDPLFFAAAVAAGVGAFAVGARKS
ncbi:MAG: DUF3866 family protein [Armatimonadaceae bacterium]